MKQLFAPGAGVSATGFNGELILNLGHQGCWCGVYIMASQCNGFLFHQRVTDGKYSDGPAKRGIGQALEYIGAPYTDRNLWVRVAELLIRVKQETTVRPGCNYLGATSINIRHLLTYGCEGGKPYT